METKEKIVDWEEFLRIQEVSEERLEYLAGKIYALATPSKAHNKVCGSIYVQLERQLKNSPCSPYLDNLAIRSGKQQVIPDGLVECEENIDLQQNHAEKPIVVFEVLSPNNDRKEMGDKLSFYQSIPTIQDYLVIDPLEVRVYHWQRKAEGLVINPVIVHRESVIKLESIGANLGVKDLYGHLP